MIFTPKVFAATAVTLLVIVATGGLVMVRPLPIDQTNDSSKKDQSVAVSPQPTSVDFVTLWATDFMGDRVMGLNKEGKIVWQQHMTESPIPPRGYNTNTEYVTVAPNGNLIVADGDGMMVQEIDRATHELKWQYGVKDKQGYSDGLIHQPDKAFKLNDQEVLINDGNNRRVVIIDQNTNQIVWQYGKTLQMGSTPGLLRANTSAVPINDGQQFVITDTLDKKVIIINRSDKAIVWEWRKSDAKWIQHVWPTPEGTFVMEDRQKQEVFEVDRSGKILWTLNKLADGSTFKYPTDTIKLNNGHVLVADGGRNLVIEVVPNTGEIIKTYKGVGFVTTIYPDPQGV